MIQPNEKGLILCPKKFFKPLERKTSDLIQNEYPQATREERELISGLCSNKCFNEFIGRRFLK
jgi:hypothetical protein